MKNKKDASPRDGKEAPVDLEDSLREGRSESLLYSIRTPLQRKAEKRILEAYELEHI